MHVLCATKENVQRVGRLKSECNATEATELPKRKDIAKAEQIKKRTTKAATQPRDLPFAENGSHEQRSTAMAMAMDRGPGR